MGIKNPTIRKGTEGKPVFLQVAEDKVGGHPYWFAIRPMVTPKMLGQGVFGLQIAFRMRVEAVSQTASLEYVRKAVVHLSPNNSETHKYKPQYGSYVLQTQIKGKVDHTAHIIISKLKTEYAKGVNQILNHVQNHVSGLDHDRADILNYLMAYLDKECAKMHIDIGDLDPSVPAPQVQQFVADYEKGKAANKSVTKQLGGQPVIKPEPKEDEPPMTQEQADKYANKQKENLADMSFSELMASDFMKVPNKKGGKDANS